MHPVNEDKTGPRPPATQHADPHAGAEHAGLTDVGAAVLAFEQTWWRYPGAKETAVRDRFGWSMTRYYQVLNALIDTPAALAADPLTVNRLRRVRADRRKARGSSQ